MPNLISTTQINGLSGFVEGVVVNITPNIVRTTGDQSITGSKNFASPVVFANDVGMGSSNFDFSGSNLRFDPFASLSDSFGNGTVFPYLGILRDNFGADALDWSGRNFFGQWTVDTPLAFGIAETVLTSGDQLVSGNKTFANVINIAGNVFSGDRVFGSGYPNNFLNIQSGTLSSSGQTSLDWTGRELLGQWTMDTSPAIGLGKPVLTTGDQLISGTKTFGSPVNFGVAQAVLTSGTQSITGVKTFVGETTNVHRLAPSVAIGGINFFPQVLLAAGSVGAVATGQLVTNTAENSVSLDWMNKILSGQWRSDKPLNVGTAQTVLTSGDQTVSGNKTFVGVSSFSGNIFSGERFYNTLSPNNYVNIRSGLLFSSSAPSLNWVNRELSGQWKADLPINVGTAQTVLTTGIQTISGNKTFADNIFPKAYSAFNLLLSSTGQFAPAGGVYTTALFSRTVQDTHGVSNGTGITAPRAGWYQISSSLVVQDAGTLSRINFVLKASSPASSFYATELVGATPMINYTVSASTVVYANSGAIIEGQFFSVGTGIFRQDSSFRGIYLGD